MASKTEVIMSSTDIAGGVGGANALGKQHPRGATTHPILPFLQAHF